MQQVRFQMAFWKATIVTRRDGLDQSANLSWRGEAAVAISDISHEMDDASPVPGLWRKIVQQDAAPLILRASTTICVDADAP
jgi:hypothetical protein